MSSSVKVCGRCGEEKSLEDFHMDRTRRDGLTYWCKSCRSNSIKDYRSRNREKYNSYSKKWRRSNPEAEYAIVLRSRYGLTLEGYMSILEEQKYGCAICGLVPKDGDKRLHVDHDHKTGKVRGLLCNNCNTALGFLEDDSKRIEKMLSYLALHSSQDVL